MSNESSIRRTQFLIGIGEFGLAGALLIFAAGVSFTAIMRLFDPTHWGLWVSPKMFLFGVVDNPNEAREVLGDSIYLLAIISLFLCYQAGREFFLSARQRIANSPRAN